MVQAIGTRCDSIAAASTVAAFALWRNSFPRHDVFVRAPSDVRLLASSLELNNGKDQLRQELPLGLCMGPCSCLQIGAAAVLQGRGLGLER